MKKWIVFLLAIGFTIYLQTSILTPIITNAEDETQDTLQLSGLQDFVSYETYLNNHADATLVDQVISIDLFDYETDSTVDELENTIVTAETGKITWTFTVEVAGFYNLRVDYYPTEGRSSSIQREIFIDGEIPFLGANQVEFERVWVDNGDILIKGDNEIRPDQAEQPEWMSTYVEDSQKFVQGPLKFYLSKGTHTLTFNSVREPMELSNVVFEKAKDVLSYEAYKKQMSQYNVYNGDPIKFQSERLDGDDNALVNIKKSSPTLYAVSNFSSSKVEPYHPYNIRLNTIGGENWRVIGDWVSWEVEVETAGLYQLSLSALQNTNRGTFSVRELKINGEVPFQEAYAINFKYDSNFQMVTLGNETEPYLFYLEEGVNSISLEVALGEMGPIIEEVKESVTILNDLYRQITQITGTAPKDYIDYQLDKKLPIMEPTFKQEQERLSSLVSQIENIAGDKSDQTALLDQMAVQLKNLIENPKEIINEIARFQGNISAMSTWILEASEQPLMIDYFVLSAPDAKLPRVKANIFEVIYFEIFRLFSTFFVDYNNFSSDDNQGDQESIDVWIQSGRDQAQLLRNLIDNSFAVQENVNVNLKLIPQGVVLPATFSGNGPDVVLSMTGDTTVNFALRNAAQDLTVFEDFDEVASQFMPSSFDTVKFEDGVYGLPETQSFYMLFYREDILNELGLEVPKTWEDVYAMIPVLEMNNYQFYIPSNLQMYATLLTQMDGKVYEGTGFDLGIESGLTSKPAMESFEMWTNFFTSYKLPIEANFSNRFRTGEMPIGIADYTTYNTFVVFAPEISGLWGFSPLPGVEKEDGSINNQSVSTVINSMMLSSSDNKEASWEFLKWWVSADIQVDYGRGLEAIMGAAARYNTANIDAISRLPWSSQDYDQLMEQFNTVFTIPEVPGGYITGRHVDYALRSVVNDGLNAREALYENVKSINEELTIKRKEFNLSTIKKEGK